MKAISYMLVFSIFMLLYFLSMRWLLPLSGWMLWIDALIHTLLLAVLVFLLWNAIRYGNFESLPAHQLFINYTALSVLFVLVWSGLGYLVEYILFGKSLSALFIPVLPTKSLIGLLLYFVYVQRCRYFLLLSHQKEEALQDHETGMEIVQEILPELPVSELLERVTVKSGQKIHVISIPDIIYIQAEGDYVHIITEDGKYLKEQTMKFFETHLPSNQFVRIHRSYIVHVEKISRIELYENKSQQLTLKNGDKLKASSSGYRALRAVLNL
ncbi:MAG: LytTR family transcriptional regulator DNA-binding domain-containing protein [Bacteroidales bacterium]|nr:LytTR family transcriptional regulator DNA-binding domain-containing protein [Bacteroidales bacterium]